MSSLRYDFVVQGSAETHSLIHREGFGHKSLTLETSFLASARDPASLASLSPAFESLSTIQLTKKTPKRESFLLVIYAGEEGFEPPNAWTKTMCLTTWRLPNIFKNYFTILPPKTCIAS